MRIRTGLNVLLSPKDVSSSFTYNLFLTFPKFLRTDKKLLNLGYVPNLYH